jgi:hypothetical protein
LIWLLQKETGWTDEYVLWGTSWANLQLKLADAAHYNYGKKKPKLVDDERELNELLMQFK